MSFLNQVLNNNGNRAPVKIIDENNGNAPDCSQLARNTDGSIALVVAGEHAWHRRGKVADRLLTVSEARPLGGLDFELRLDDATHNGTPIRSRFVVVRVDVNGAEAPLDVVGGKFTNIQTDEACELFEAAVGDGACVSSAGVLDDGRKYFMSAETGELEVRPGDVTKQFFTMLGTNDGSGYLVLLPSDFRVVCFNTYSAARAAGKNVKGWRIRHTSSAEQKMRDIKRDFQDARESHRQHFAACQQMAQQAIRRADISRLVNTVLDSFCTVKLNGSTVKGSDIATQTNGQILTAVNLPTFDESATKKIERQRRTFEKYRDEILTNYRSETCAEDSVYDAWNAVTQFADHSKLMSYKGDRAAENRWLSNLNGRSDDIKTLAFNECFALVN